MRGCDLPKAEAPERGSRTGQTNESKESEQEKRITRLEENSYFQERQLAELQDALLGQGQEIKRLRRQLETLQQNVALLREFLVEAGGGDSGKDPLPPHYLPEDLLRCWTHETKRES